MASIISNKRGKGEEVPHLVASVDHIIGDCADPINQYNPTEVQRLLANELNDLSLDHRERATEEIHGVVPQRRRDSIDKDCNNDAQLKRRREEDVALSKLQKELDNYYYSSIRNGNGKSKSKSNGAPFYQAYHRARTGRSALLNDRGFLLSCLLVVGMDPKKGAIRLLRYLDFVWEIYETDEVLFRPIHLSDLSGKREEGSSETTVFTGGKLINEEGILQIMPVRDTSGRRIIVHLREMDMAYPVKSRQQMGMYMMQCISEEPNGAVLVLFLHGVSHNTIDSREEIQSIHRMIGTVRVKFSAMHFCCPKGPFYDVVKATYTMIVGKENRTRLRFHVGSYQECKYSLKSFGIPVDRLPNNLFFQKTETFMKNNLQNHRKWLKIREALERATQEEMRRLKASAVATAVSSNATTTSDSFFSVHNVVENNENFDSVAEMMAIHSVRSKFIDCPYHEDCLFGKGRPAMKHPGNIAMRRLLAENYERYEYDAIHKSVVALEILDEIKRGSGRFLREGIDQYAGLMIQVDDKTALQKINIAFRDLRKRRLRLDKTCGEKRSISPTPVMSLSSSFNAAYNNIDDPGLSDENCAPRIARKRSHDDSPTSIPTISPECCGSSNNQYGISPLHDF